MITLFHLPTTFWYDQENTETLYNSKQKLCYFTIPAYENYRMPLAVAWEEKSIVPLFPPCSGNQSDTSQEIM
jgi:hypothetical protein